MVLLFSDAILLYTCYSLAAFLTLDADPQVFLRYDGGWLRIAIVMLSVVAGLYFLELYKRYRHSLQDCPDSAGWREPWRCFSVSGLARISRPSGLVRSQHHNDCRQRDRPRVSPDLAYVLRVICKALGCECVLLLGSSQLIHDVCAHWATHTETGFTAIGCLDDSSRDSLISGVALL